jgi:hypothetical protein
MSREPLTFQLQIGIGVTARITAEVIEEPRGGTDPDIRREPTVQEMDEIAEAMRGRRWHFSKP